MNFCDEKIRVNLIGGGFSDIECMRDKGHEHEHMGIAMMCDKDMDKDCAYCMFCDKEHLTEEGTNTKAECERRNAMLSQSEAHC